MRVCVSDFQSLVQLNYLIAFIGFSGGIQGWLWETFIWKDSLPPVSAVSVEGIYRKQTEDMGYKMCGNEPYELKMCTQYFSASVAENTLGILETTNYDLRSAVKRQNSFFIR